MNEFRKLGIDEHILQALQKLDFHEPTEVQEKTIPAILQGKDVIAGSATGSGKTLAFGAGIIHHCKPGEGLQSLVLVPTRELAVQVAHSLEDFSKYHRLQITTVYGGVSIEPQIRKLYNTDVVVGTPGRILDHMQRRTIRLGKVSILVLDEADRMLDMGFVRDVETIIRECPEKRQTLMFSATISGDIDHLSKRYMKNPVRVIAESYIDPSKLKQYYYNVTDDEKFSLLVYLLRNEDAKLVMVFCNTKHNTDFVANNLQANGINALAIHGGFSQDKRDYVMEQFHNKKVSVMVCTDVAARGLDIKGVSHVYNYDLPADSKAYIHRIGRTARAGNEGKAISILARRDHDSFRQILRDRRLNIDDLPLPDIGHVSIKWHETRRSFGGSRGSGFGRGRGRSFGNDRGHGQRRSGYGHSGDRNRRPSGRRSWSSRR